MAELAFVKSFLSTLDNRPIKLQADYAIDPKVLELKGPFTLPRMPHAMTLSSKTSAPGSAPALTVSLKSLRNPPLDILLPAKPFTTSVLDLKQAVAEHLGSSGTEKIRLLYKKKPCADSKTIKEIVGDQMPPEVEFSVMIVGGVVTDKNNLPAADASKATGGDTRMEDAPVAQGDSGLTVMETVEFWEDLKGFLVQRVRNEEVGMRAAKTFEKVWRKET